MSIIARNLWEFNILMSCLLALKTFQFFLMLLTSLLFISSTVCFFKRNIKKKTSVKIELKINLYFNENYQFIFFQFLKLLLDRIPFKDKQNDSFLKIM